MDKLKTCDIEVLKEPDGKLLCSKTLSLIGQWFEVDGIIYYIKL